MIALGVVLGDADILVHVEGDDVLEGDLAGLVGLHQLLIHAQGGAARGQPQHKHPRHLIFIIFNYRVSQKKGGLAFKCS